MANWAGGDVFLLLPLVLLEGRASMDGFGIRGLDLATIERLLKRVRAKGGRELSRTMLPMGEGLPYTGRYQNKSQRNRHPSW